MVIGGSHVLSSRFRPRSRILLHFSYDLSTYILCSRIWPQTCRLRYQDNSCAEAAARLVRRLSFCTLNGYGGATAENVGCFGLPSHHIGSAGACSYSFRSGIAVFHVEKCWKLEIPELSGMRSLVRCSQSPLVAFQLQEGTS